MAVEKYAVHNGLLSNRVYKEGERLSRQRLINCARSMERSAVVLKDERLIQRRCRVERIAVSMTGIEIFAQPLHQNHRPNVMTE